MPPSRKTWKNYARPVDSSWRVDVENRLSLPSPEKLRQKWRHPPADLLRLSLDFNSRSSAGRFVRGDAIRIPLAVRRRVDAAQNNPTCGEPYKAHSQSRGGDSETRSSRNPCWP